MTSNQLWSEAHAAWVAARGEVDRLRAERDRLRAAMEEVRRDIAEVNDKRVRQGRYAWVRLIRLEKTLAAALGQENGEGKQ